MRKQQWNEVIVTCKHTNGICWYKMNCSIFPWHLHGSSRHVADLNNICVSILYVFCFTLSLLPRQSFFCLNLSFIYSSSFYFFFCYYYIKDPEKNIYPNVKRIVLFSFLLYIYIYMKDLHQSIFLSLICFGCYIFLSLFFIILRM